MIQSIIVSAMEKLQMRRCSSVDWKPSAVLALATSFDGSQVAAVREDGTLEIWLVAPGSVGWHCQLVNLNETHFLGFLCLIYAVSFWSR